MDVIKDSADVSTYFTLRDSTNHAPKTDVTITDIDLYYVAYKAAISAKADATALAAADSAHADNKAFHVGSGLYRIDWPDVWTGAVGTQVQLLVVCTGVDTTFLEVNIVSPAQTGDSYAKVSGLTFTVAGDVDVNVQSWKGSAAPDISDDATIAAAVRDVAIAGAAASSVGAAIASALADTNELQTDWVNGGRLDLILDAVLAMLDAARAEPGQGAPPVNADAMTKLDYLYKAWRNKTLQSATEYKLYNDAGDTVDQKATVSDDATDFTRGEVGTGA